MKAITAQEIRIGNILLSPNTDRYVVIELDHIIYIAKEQPFSTSEYKPIPLTEEWLLKFGFKETINSKFVKYWHKEFVNGVVELYHEYYRDNPLIVYGGYAEINHVHQLQNLFFALTGEELTIK